VLTHAIIDALLGAASLGDIGTHFPDHDPRYEGISSLTLLGEAFNLVREEAWLVGNVDVVVIAEEPPINPYRNAMQTALSEILRILPDDISIKATTMEGKGPVGRKEGIAVQAVVLLYKEA
jgi:2-C-methyl-D-erythritol 2,4-cyclodiphosphate synthase